MTDRRSQSSKTSITKIVLWVLAVFFILLVAGIVLVGYKWKPFVKAKLENAVLKGSDGLYNLKIGSISANIFTGHIALNNTTLLPDTQVYQRLIALKKAPDKLFHLRLKALNINGLPFLQAYFYRNLDIGAVAVTDPDFTVISQNQPYNQAAKKQKPKTLYQLTSDVFKKIAVSDISFQNINFTYLDKNGTRPQNTSFKNLNIKINQFLIDATSADDTTRFLSSKSLELRLPGYQMATADSLYYLKVKDVYFSTDKRRLLIKNLSYLPRYDKVAFFKKVKVQQLRYDLDFGLIAINQLDINRFSKRYEVFSGSAKISKARVDIFTNNAYPEEAEKPQRADFPQQRLQELTTKLKIDTLFLDDTNISYGEADASSGRTGTVTFDKINGKILNITNDALSKKQNQTARAILKCQFLNTADLNVNFNFNLQSANGACNFGATMGPINAPAINQLTVPLALLQLKSGTVQKLDFKVDADNNQFNGTMHLFYTDLQIAALKRESGQKNLQTKELLSVLANTFVINTNNPENGEFRVGDIQYTRSAGVPFFGSVWKSLLSGIKSSAGVSAAQQKVKQSTTKHRTGINKVLHKVGSFLGI